MTERELYNHIRADLNQNQPFNVRGHTVRVREYPGRLLSASLDPVYEVDDNLTFRSLDELLAYLLSH